jgi:hypothetical protein
MKRNEQVISPDQHAETLVPCPSIALIFINTGVESCQEYITN